jgi:branched-subunit amino acid transport protein
MYRNHIRVLGCAAVAIFTAIFLPAFLGDRQTDGWTRFVYDYQTLLTGTFAVAAAFITVAQMRASDERQDLRTAVSLR